MAWEDRPYYRDEGTNFRSRFGFTPPTPVAMWLMGACLGVFVLQALTGDIRFGPGGGWVTNWFGLTFNGGRAFAQPWRWVTYQYVHGGPLHVFFNIIMIYFLVPPLERLWGGARTFAFYTAGGIAAGLLAGLIHLFYPFGALVGASGSIFAMLGAMALLFPEMQVMVMFVIPMSIRLLAVLLGLLYFLFTITGDASDAAHLGGLLFGFAAPAYGRGLIEGWADRARNWKQAKVVEAERDAQATIDRILEKVHHQGMNSLSRSERNTLKRATERQRQQDLARARRRD